MAISAREQQGIDFLMAAAHRGGLKPTQDAIRKLSAKAPRSDAENELLKKLRTLEAQLASPSMRAAASQAGPGPLRTGGGIMATTGQPPARSMQSRAISAATFFGNILINKVKAGEVPREPTIEKYRAATRKMRDPAVQQAMQKILQGLINIAPSAPLPNGEPQFEPGEPETAPPSTTPGQVDTGMDTSWMATQEPPPPVEGTMEPEDYEDMDVSDASGNAMEQTAQQTADEQGVPGQPIINIQVPGGGDGGYEPPTTGRFEIAIPLLVAAVGVLPFVLGK